MEKDYTKKIKYKRTIQREITQRKNYMESDYMEKKKVLKLVLFKQKLLLK